MSSRPLLRPLCGLNQELLERSEAYLSAVNLWAENKGHGQMIADKVGSGKFAAVVGLARKSMLTEDAPRSMDDLQRKSGLSPSAFTTALELLQPAIDDYINKKAPKTPRKDRDHGPGMGIASASGSPRTPSSRAGSVQGSSARTPGKPSTPQAHRQGESGGLSLRERAQAVQSGAAFGMASPSNSSRGSRTPGLGSVPGTPRGSSSGLARDTAAGTEQDQVSGPSTPSRSALKTPLRYAGDPSRTPGSRSSLSGSATSTPKSVRFNTRLEMELAQRAARKSGRDQRQGDSDVRLSPGNFAGDAGQGSDRALALKRRRELIEEEEHEEEERLGRSALHQSAFDDEDGDEEAGGFRIGQRRLSRDRRSSSGGTSAKTPSVAREAHKRRAYQQLDRSLPFVLFPLAVCTMDAAVHPAKSSSAGRAAAAVEAWMAGWGSWLDEEEATDDTQDVASMDED